MLFLLRFTLMMDGCSRVSHYGIKEEKLVTYWAFVALACHISRSWTIWFVNPCDEPNPLKFHSCSDSVCALAFLYNCFISSVQRVYWSGDVWCEFAGQNLWTCLSGGGGGHVKGCEHPPIDGCLFVRMSLGISVCTYMWVFLSMLCNQEAWPKGKPKMICSFLRS